MVRSSRLFSRKIIAALLLSVSCMTVPAFAAENRFNVDTRLTLQYIGENDPDLGTASDDRTDSFSEQIQILVGADVTENLFGFFHGRALNINGGSGFDDDTGNTISSDQSFLELRELYLQQEELFGVIPLSLQLGRQRVREARSLWWNSDNDLVRLKYNSTLLNGFIGAGENLSSYRLGGEDEDFLPEDEDKFRILGEASWQYSHNHFLEGRFAYEDDHSGLEPAGSTIQNDDRDDEDQNIVWAGVRAAGEFKAPAAFSSGVKYRADIIGAIGDEDELETTGGPGVNQRTVTGSAARDVRAWAFDGGVTIDPGGAGGAVVTAGYAYGSGDDNPGGGTDHEFRQTGMQGSSSRIGLERQQQKNYGEVLHPELSNLHIASLGVDYPVSENINAGVTYFNYHLAENAVRLRNSGVSAPLNGTDDFVGQAADFAVNVDVDDAFDMERKYAKDVDFRFVVGSFFPGDAYEPDGDNSSFRVLAELKFKL